MVAETVLGILAGVALALPVLALIGLTALAGLALRRRRRPTRKEAL